MALTSQQRKFRTVAKAVNAVCHRDTNSVSAYKKCMSEGMTRGLGSKKKGRGGRRGRRK